MSETTAFLIILIWMVNVVVLIGWGVANGRYCYTRGRLDESRLYDDQWNVLALKGLFVDEEDA